MKSSLKHICSWRDKLVLYYSNALGGRDGISRGIKERTCGGFRGQLKKEVKFPGVLKKNWCTISMGPGFWPWNFQEVPHNFAEFPGVKVCFLWKF